MSSAALVTAAESPAGPPRHALQVTLSGCVQGLGVRPAIARLAQELGLCGSVANALAGVVVEVEGAAAALAEFRTRLPAVLPAGVDVRALAWEAATTCGASGFVIAESHAAQAGPRAVEPPRDRVVCRECLAEVRTPGERRHGYAFTSCTQCGPRYSVLHALPYDRERTGLAGFPLCDDCRREYRHPADRRFHAQTLACPRCGPQVWFAQHGCAVARGSEALSAAAQALQAGLIVALKGVGGYQLLALARSEPAVRRLRERKGRAEKPLAVMPPSLAAAERLVQLSPAERALLTSAAGPIVTATARKRGDLAPSVAPGLTTLGVLLPTSPVHALLLDRVNAAVVCTSGNREGEPLAFDEQTAEQELAGLADAYLHHNRPIVRPIDDSVVRVIAGQPCVLRLARGLAPLALPGLAAVAQGALERPLLALGGEQKAALALAAQGQALLGPHVGELSSLAVCRRWEEQLAALGQLYGVTAGEALVVRDLHPDYYTTRWAEGRGVASLAVQHHHAHIAAAALEHGLLAQPVLGLAWDGTGYGYDGTIWGGEALRVQGAVCRRVAWLRPFSLPGGERAIREPWRAAVALVQQACGAAAAAALAWPEVAPQQAMLVVERLVRGSALPLCSSVGRLFDAVAALVLGVTQSTDEARLAMLLEAACDLSEPGAYPLPWSPASGIIETAPLIQAILGDRQSAVAPGRMAMRFHRGLARLAAELAAQWAELPLVVAGGVFQNGVLGELLAAELAGRRAGYFPPRQIPPGDGGLAAGQLAVALAQRGLVTATQ